MLNPYSHFGWGVSPLFFYSTHHFLLFLPAISQSSSNTYHLFTFSKILVFFFSKSKRSRLRGLHFFFPKKCVRGTFLMERKTMTMCLTGKLCMSEITQFNVPLWWELWSGQEYIQLQVTEYSNTLAEVWGLAAPWSCQRHRLLFWFSIFCAVFMSVVEKHFACFREWEGKEIWGNLPQALCLRPLTRILWHVYSS